MERESIFFGQRGLWFLLCPQRGVKPLLVLLQLMIKLYPGVWQYQEGLLRGLACLHWVWVNAFEVEVKMVRKLAKTDLTELPFQYSVRNQVVE